MPVERRGVRALQIWCQRVTASYPEVKIVDMSSSWRDGLAFAAIIHHFRPNIIDFHSLKSENILENNRLAFEVAEEQLGIPSLLDPQDMVDSEVPDKFSVITYVSQFYHLLKEEDDSRSPSLARAALRSSLSEGSNDSSPSPILSNNKFSPMASPVPGSPEPSDLQILLHSQTHLKSPATGVTVSGVCEDFSRKIQISRNARFLGDSEPWFITSSIVIKTYEHFKTNSILL